MVLIPGRKSHILRKRKINGYSLKPGGYVFLVHLKEKREKVRVNMEMVLLGSM